MDSSCLARGALYHDGLTIPATPQYSNQSCSSSYSYENKTLSPGLTSARMQTMSGLDGDCFRALQINSPEGSIMQRPSTSLGHHPQPPAPLLSSASFGSNTRSWDQRPPLKQLPAPSATALAAPRPKTSLGFHEGHSSQNLHLHSIDLLQHAGLRQKPSSLQDDLHLRCHPGGVAQQDHPVKLVPTPGYSHSSPNAYSLSPPSSSALLSPEASLSTVPEYGDVSDDYLSPVSLSRGISPNPTYSGAATLAAAAACSMPPVCSSMHSAVRGMGTWSSSQLPALSSSSLAVGAGPTELEALLSRQCQEQQQRQEQQQLLMHYIWQKRNQQAIALQQARAEAQAQADVMASMLQLPDAADVYPPNASGRRPLTIQVPDLPPSTASLVSSQVPDITNLYALDGLQGLDDDDDSTVHGWSNMPSPFCEAEYLGEHGAPAALFADSYVEPGSSSNLLSSPCNDPAPHHTLLDSADFGDLNTDQQQGQPQQQQQQLPAGITQEDPDISYQTLSQVWMKPIQVAASELGVSKFRLKKVCNMYNISRWPHRKIKCLQNLVVEMEEEGADQADVAHVKQQLANVQCNPTAPLDSETKRQLRVYAKKRFVQKHGNGKQRVQPDDDQQDDWA